jgi:integrase
MIKGKRYTGEGYRTKTDAKQAEAKQREEVETRKNLRAQTDMGFLDMINLRLDYLKDFSSEKYYYESKNRAGRWVKEWNNTPCGEITPEAVESFLRKRKKVSEYTANSDLRSLRAAFNWALKKRKYISFDPTDGLEYFPIREKTHRRHIPAPEEIDKVLAVATAEQQDYLTALRETMARVGEINRLTWEDVDLETRVVILYTRKKRGGNLTPRRIPMTNTLYQVLKRLHGQRRAKIKWVFWHEYFDRAGNRQVGPYKDRKRMMKSLCRKAGVPYFRYHPIRASGASVMDLNHVPIGSIQRILGHENRTTTEIYLHRIGDPERKAMEVFERVNQGLARVPEGNSHQISHQDEGWVTDRLQ